MHRLSWPLLAALLLASEAPGQSHEARAWLRKSRTRIGKLATRWWKARPLTAFDSWDQKRRQALEREVRAFGQIPEGIQGELVKLLWQPLAKHPPGRPAPKRKDKKKRHRKKTRKGEKKIVIATPYGDAWAYVTGSGKNRPLILGLHGGGEGAGSAAEPKSTWKAKSCIGIYPQGIALVHDTWNTVHGERFLLTLIEIAKVRFEVDPDRIYSMGFSMGGSGSWFMAGRHPDLLAGASPCAGVLMAEPKSQLASKEEVKAIQHGLVPNVRNLCMYYYIGLSDRNCMPGTYLYVQDMLERLRREDQGGYRRIHFKSYPGLAHAFPPGEPAKGIRFLLEQRRETFPETLVWEYASDPFPQAGPDDRCARIAKRYFYWIKCEEPLDMQRIRATRSGNTIDLDVQDTKNGLEGLTIYLNPQMIDPNDEVVVRHSGKEVFRGKPQPDLWTVLETLDARLDRSMVFDRRIAF